MGESLQRWAYERAEMGVPFRVTVYAGGEEEARGAAEAALDRVRALNGVLSDYEEESELYRLSRRSGKGEVVEVSEDLWRVLEAGQRMAERSGGAFDVTVGPVVNVWRMARRKRVLPSPERLAEARDRSGYGWMRLEVAGRRVELLREGMRLDAGGIAKGYAVEEALKVLRARGCARAMVQAGGDMALGEAPPQAMGWRIEVPALDVEGAPGPRALVLSNVCVSTSGDRYQRLEVDGKRYSHVVDPRTGQALTDHSQVTVIAPHGMDSEGLSKALSVLGPESGFALLEAVDGAAALVLRAPEGRVEVHRSQRWERWERSAGPRGLGPER